MIIRQARVREVLTRTLEDGTESHSVLVSFDEASSTTVRLSPDESALFRHAVATKRRFVMTLEVATDLRSVPATETGAA